MDDLLSSLPKHFNDCYYFTCLHGEKKKKEIPKPLISFKYMLYSTEYTCPWSSVHKLFKNRQNKEKKKDTSRYEKLKFERTLVWELSLNAFGFACVHPDGCRKGTMKQDLALPYCNFSCCFFLECSSQGRACKTRAFR